VSAVVVTFTIPHACGTKYVASWYPALVIDIGAGFTKWLVGRGCSDGS